jgi:hypothetical protein
VEGRERERERRFETANGVREFLTPFGVAGAGFEPAAFGL